VPTFVFDLEIPPEDWLLYYSGTAKAVVARARDGRRVRFAAKHLHRFIARDGIHGAFRLVIDDANRFVSLERVGGGEPGCTG